MIDDIGDDLLQGVIAVTTASLADVQLAVTALIVDVLPKMRSTQTTDEEALREIEAHLRDCDAMAGVV